MIQILGVGFAVMAVILSIVIVYCVWMAFMVGAGWLFVAAGILLTDVVTIAIAMMLLGE
jgi:hypothetical protein